MLFSSDICRRRGLHIPNVLLNLGLNIERINQNRAASFPPTEKPTKNCSLQHNSIRPYCQI